MKKRSYDEKLEREDRMDDSDYDDDDDDDDDDLYDFDVHDFFMQLFGWVDFFIKRIKIKRT